MEKKNSFKNNLSFTFSPKIGVSNRNFDGLSTTEIQVPTTLGFKKWLHFTSKEINILLSYSTFRNLTLSWPKKPMTHCPLNLGPTLGPTYYEHT
jgi:hypothetical protein